MSTTPGDTCKICGKGPAITIKLRRHVGMLVLQKFYKFDGPVCREHGLQLANTFLKKTLLQGWWGITSFFFNIFAVIADLTTRARVARMPAPSQAEAPRA